MAFFSEVINATKSVIDSAGGLNVGGTTLYTLADVGVVLLFGVAVFYLGKSAYEKFFKKPAPAVV